jgi:serralysin
MYLKFDGSPIPESGSTDGEQFWGTNAPEHIDGTDRNDTLNGNGGDTLVGHFGDDIFYLNSPGNTVEEHRYEGIDTVVTFMSYTLPDNVENLTVTGDGLVATGNGQDNLIKVGDSNNMTLVGGGGNDVLVGGAGSDVFVAAAGDGSVSIYNWHSGDKIRLPGSDLKTFDDIRSAMRQSGGDVVIQDNRDHIVIHDVQASRLSAADFDLAVAGLGALTFGDEFSSLSLRSASNPDGLWNTSYGQAGPDSPGSYTLMSNGERQIYVAPGFQGATGHDLNLSPFSISEDGVLDITARHTGPSSDYWNYDYTSGVLTTKASFSQTYGYFEMRAKMPDHADGAWPAFWLVPADGSWPPELDVMEGRGSDASQVYVTAHSQASGDHTAQGSNAAVTPTSDGFHTYGVLWTPTDLTWYVDGSEVFHSHTPADMNKPMYMIVDLAVGGMGGDPGDWNSTRMQVDYVHAYALPGEAAAAPVVNTAPSTPAASLGPTPDPAPTPESVWAAADHDWNWYL